MPNQPFVFGPVDVWVGFYNQPLVNSSGTDVQTPADIQTFGYTSEGPDFSLNNEYTNLHTDISGFVPTDKAFMSRWARIALTMTRWDPAVYEDLIDVATVSGPTDAGFINPGEIGTLLAFEGAAVALWLPSRYSINKAAFATGPDGYHFFACHLVTDSMPKLGVRPRSLSLVFDAVPVFLPSYNFDGMYGAHALYDQDMSLVNRPPT